MSCSASGTGPVPCLIVERPAFTRNNNMLTEYNGHIISSRRKYKFCWISSSIPKGTSRSLKKWLVHYFWGKNCIYSSSCYIKAGKKREKEPIVTNKRDINSINPLKKKIEPHIVPTENCESLNAFCNNKVKGENTLFLFWIISKFQYFTRFFLLSPPSCVLSSELFIRICNFPCRLILFYLAIMYWYISWMQHSK